MNKKRAYERELRTAAFNGNLDKLDKALQHGANINAVGDRAYGYDGDGDYGTALHYACFKERKDVLQRLLSANADPLVQDSAKRTAIQIAQEKGYTTILDVMKQNLEGSPEFPMYVCKREDLEELGEIQKHEVVVGHPSMVMELPANTEPRFTLFVSHRWTSNAHPDQDSQFPAANNKKLLALKAFLKCPELCEVKYIWLDFQCIPQDDPTNQQLAINSLPFYVRRCGHFVSLFGNEHRRSLIDEYLMRGWCLLEMFSSFSRHETMLWRYNIDKHEAKTLAKSSLALFISNPLVGHFTGKRTTEQRRIAPMLIRLCGLVVLEQDEDTDIKERAAEISNYIHKNSLLNSLPVFPMSECVLS